MPILPDNAELHTDHRTGKTFIRQPAGGTGGGATSFADTPASSEQHVAHLKGQVVTKEAELANAKQAHDKAEKEHKNSEAENAKAEERKRKDAEEQKAKDTGLGFLTDKRVEAVDDARREAHIADAEGRTPMRPLDRKTEGLSDDTGPSQNTGQMGNPRDKPVPNDFD